MSTETVDQPVENTENAEVQTEAPADPYALIDQNSPFAPAFKANVDFIVELTAQANQRYDQIRAQENTASLVHEIRENHEDEKVAGFREWREQLLANLADAEEKIENYIRENLMPKSDDEFDAEKAAEEAKTFADQVKAFKQALALMPGADEIVKALPTIHGVRKSSGGSVSGIGKPRISEVKLWNAKTPDKVIPVFHETEDKKNPGVMKRNVSFTILAQWLKKNLKVNVDASELRELADKEVGGNTNEAYQNYGKPFTFAISTESDNYVIEVTP